MVYLTFLLLVGVSFFGLLFHWYNRFNQGRTNNTFKQYLFRDHPGYTVQSIGAILASDIAQFMLLPEDIDLGSKPFFITLLQVFTAGYMVDSLLNKESVKDNTQLSITQTAAEILKDLNPKNGDELLQEDKKIK